MSVEDRLKQLQEAHRDFGPASQHFLSSKFLELIDACQIWQLSQTLTRLYSIFTPYGLRKFLFHNIIYLLVFVEVIRLHNVIDILTSVLHSVFLRWVCPHCFILCSLLQCLTSDCSRIFVCLWPHLFILCQLFLLFSFASTLAGMAQRKSSLCFSFSLKALCHTFLEVKVWEKQTCIPSSGPILASFW